MVNVLCKASPLDAKGGGTPFVRSLRGIAPTPVVEAEVVPEDPLDGFEI